MTTPSQKQMYYEALRKAAECDKLFQEFVMDGLTREELEACIAKRPEVWSRYERWLPLLPPTQNSGGLHDTRAKPKKRKRGMM